MGLVFSAWPPLEQALWTLCLQATKAQKATIPLSYKSVKTTLYMVAADTQT